MFPFRTTAGAKLEILSPGTRNTHAGPDFLNAVIRIDNLIWMGPVEMHLCSSFWLDHGHQLDESYNNVILHVVFRDDTSTLNNMPTLELQTYFPESFFIRLERMMVQQKWVLCESEISAVPTSIWSEVIFRQVKNRLQEHSLQVGGFLRETRGDWDQVVYMMLVRNFGFNVNTIPFEWLARRTELRIVRKYEHRRVDVEALLFGQSGLLPVSDGDSPYVGDLIDRYKWMKWRHHLHPIARHSWKFLRTRPANFPTIRLAQLSDLMSNKHPNREWLLDAKTLAGYRSGLECEARGYWREHFNFGKPSPEKSKRLGVPSVDQLIVNTVIPLLYAFGNKRGNANYRKRAMQILQELPAENDHEMIRWKKSGIKLHSAFESQGLRQLRQAMCNHKKCVHCNIGKHVMQRSDD